MTYLEFAWEHLLELGIAHALVVIVSVAIATVIGMGLGLATYRTERRDMALAVTGTFLTIPSLALFGVFISVPFLGLGARSVVVGLVMYGLLPIVRNTIVGLREVDPAIVDSGNLHRRGGAWVASSSPVSCRTDRSSRSSERSWSPFSPS